MLVCLPGVRLLWLGTPPVLCVRVLADVGEDIKPSSTTKARLLGTTGVPSARWFGTFEAFLTSVTYKRSEDPHK